MNEQDATAQIAVLVKEAKEKIREAEKIAEESNVEFDFQVAYGMGGTYIPLKYGTECGYDKDETGWRSSSHNC